MNNRRDFIRFLILGGALVPTASLFGAELAAEAPAKLNLPPDVRRFVAEKERQVKALAGKHQVELWPEVLEFFDLAGKQAWPNASEVYHDLKQSVSYPRASADEDRVGATALQAALEVELALEQFAEGEPNLTAALGREIVNSMPTGSVYLGGTDPGRGLPTAFCKSHAKGDPVFVLTQNALASGNYLVYLRDMFGGQLYVPTEKDSADAFQKYLADAQRRLEHDKKFPNEPPQIKPGEEVQMRGNKVTVSGHVSVMSINAALAKLLFDRNPTRHFFVEESFPLDWMFPHLSPHGFILKINRKPLGALTEETISQDRKFWTEQQRKLIGDWLQPETSVKAVCDFAETVFVKQDLEKFKGDSEFVRNRSTGATYSKLRSAIGGVYAWRAKQAGNPAEKKRMQNEADFAFRQAFAFYPGSAEAVFRYTSLLIEQKRFDDALCFARIGAEVDPGRGNYQGLMTELERLKQAETR